MAFRPQIAWLDILVDVVTDDFETPVLAIHVVTESVSLKGEISQVSACRINYNTTCSTV